MNEFAGTIVLYNTIVLGYNEVQLVYPRIWKRADIVDKQLQRISELKQQILAAGYHPVQFNDITKEVIGKVGLANITFEQSCELIETLEYYCEFSKKCKGKL
jgi:hypothetical protein